MLLVHLPVLLNDKFVSSEVEVGQQSVLHRDSHLIHRVHRQIESTGSCLVELGIVAKVVEPSVHEVFVATSLLHLHLTQQELFEAIKSDSKWHSIVRALQLVLMLNFAFSCGCCHSSSSSGLQILTRLYICSLLRLLRGR